MLVQVRHLLWRLQPDEPSHERVILQHQHGGTAQVCLVHPSLQQQQPSHLRGTCGAVHMPPGPGPCTTPTACQHHTLV
jgi:hypothetical protein